MNEHKINEQYSIYYLTTVNGVRVELHDFDNLTMFRDVITLEEFEAMKENPKRFI